MTFPSHILLGIILGKLTGNIALSVIISVSVDIDHLFSYFKHDIILKPKAFLKAALSRNDAYGDQRGYLHNIFIAGAICALTFLISTPPGVTVTLAYFGHLLLDSLDKSDYWPLYPSKRFDIRGFVDYYSVHELLFDAFLAAIIVTLFVI